jgi:signal transduction histidine kinase
VSAHNIPNDVVAELRELLNSGAGNYRIRLMAGNAADQIEALRRSVDNLMKTVDAKQAKIDALMQEFCPGEMSAEQRQRWEDHQAPISAAEETALLAALQEAPRG